MIQHNQYHGGKVQSLGFENEEGRVTAGVMAPGEYQFGTSEDERMVVTSGEMHVRLPDADDHQPFAAGDEFFVAAGNQFDVKIELPVAYLCFYG